MSLQTRRINETETSTLQIISVKIFHHLILRKNTFASLKTFPVSRPVQS